MPPSDFRPHSGRYLSFFEREEIAICRASGYGVREIARHLGRSPSAISRELRPNAGTRGRPLVLPAVIAQALYVQGRGALKRELVACLRTGRALRVPRARARQRRDGMVTPEVMISARPAEAGDRAVPGHWESQWCCQAALAGAGGVAA